MLWQFQCPQLNVKITSSVDFNKTNMTFIQWLTDDFEMDMLRVHGKHRIKDKKITCYIYWYYLQMRIYHLQHSFITSVNKFQAFNGKCVAPNRNTNFGANFNFLLCKNFQCGMRTENMHWCIYLFNNKLGTFGNLSRTRNGWNFLWII